jgi:hypothetical protein
MCPIEYDLHFIQGFYSFIELFIMRCAHRVLNMTPCHTHYYTQITNFIIHKSEEVGNTRHCVMLWCHNGQKKKTKDKKMGVSPY